MTIKCEYTLELTLQGPFITQASGTLAWGVDSAMLRYRDQPVISGSLIRGYLREAMQSISSCLNQRKQAKHSDDVSTSMNQWFGTKSVAGSFEPLRANVMFDLFWVLQDKEQFVSGIHRSRIKVGENQKVEDGALQVIEDCFPAGTEPTFVGVLKAKFASQKEQQLFEKLIKMALEMIPAMGSFKGIGFGRLLNAELKSRSLRDKTWLDDSELQGDETRIKLSFTPDRPFCLGRPRRPDSNRIVSDEVITGNVIKALLADSLRDDLAAFNALSISHCEPVTLEKQQPLKSLVPLSIAVDVGVKPPIVYDMATLAGDQQFSGELAFQSDWKPPHWDAVNAELGYQVSESDEQDTQLKKLLLVRTEIDTKSQVSAKSALFTLECIDPIGFEWQGVIDLNGVDHSQRGDFLQKLRQHLKSNELTGVGKTKAALGQIRLTPLENLSTRTVQEGDEIVIILTSQARLFRSGFERDETPATAKTLYEEYWNSVSDGAVSLVRFFAKQTRRGGEYHARRFQKGQAYSPEWLTEEGSVFVLKVTDATKVNPALATWINSGLPVSQSQDKKPVTWQETPYLPEHGFGQIIVSECGGQS